MAGKRPLRSTRVQNQRPEAGQSFHSAASMERSFSRRMFSAFEPPRLLSASRGGNSVVLVEMKLSAAHLPWCSQMS